ncbi:DUF5677 domain-containing protein [Shewanella sp. 10N.286.52.A9]|uniref:DUF5677 domain-containing protein n=1 Tax=Shewanella sp. 10N.286.52.A9 TaxID=3229711 RepID=UPI0035517AA5
MTAGTVDDWVGLLKFRNEKFKSIKHNNLQEKYILALSIRVSELCLDAVILLNNRRISSVPVILRSALESYVDLQCCIRDVNHPSFMTKAQHWRLYELHKHINSGAAEEYKKLGKKLSVWERFKKAELVELYNAYYSYLSMHSHGNVGALAENSDGEKVILGSAYDDEKSLQYFDQAINLVALSIKDVLVFYHFDSDSIEYPAKIIDKINKKL